MMFSVLVEPKSSGYQAIVVGMPNLKADGATRDEAVIALKASLNATAARGDLLTIDVPTLAISDTAGSYRDGEAEILREICAEIYRERDAEKAAEFPE